VGRLTELKEYDYNLPSGLIAQEPARPRDYCRLMVLSRETGHIEHKTFVDIVELVKPGDLLVINDTKVINGRLLGRKRNSQGKVEVLLLRRLAKIANPRRKSQYFREVWETIVRPGRRMREGTEVLFWRNSWTKLSSPGNSPLTGKVLSREGGKFIFGFDFEGTFERKIEKVGVVPLPPYIKRDVGHRFIQRDRKWYQTVYAREEGAIAAPTAGLHFTRRLLQRLEAKGARVVPLTLHVSWGTFRPVREAEITRHKIEPEYFELTIDSAKAINEAIENESRIIAVGTTTVRALESCCIERKLPIPRRFGKKFAVKPRKGWTKLFIYPGYEFRVVDGLVTNFHLPRSSLLMLVAAFAGRDRLFHAYGEAMKENYRFYSYGDAMFII